MKMNNAINAMKTASVNPSSTTDFSGSAQQLLYIRYGDPRLPGWQKKWMIRWEIRKDFSWFPAGSIYVHKDFKVQLGNAFRQLEVNKLHHEIKTFDGAFNIRYVRGSDVVLSVHSWGAAIDMNAAENPLGAAGKWSAAFLEAMLLNGVFCGQNWIGRKDPMHFALVNG
ncbi:M15 family metallopeptidase [Chitinophagaceae bacterium MMS25-I14]